MDTPILAIYSVSIKYVHNFSECINKVFSDNLKIENKEWKKNSNRKNIIQFHHIL